MTTVISLFANGSRRLAANLFELSAQGLDSVGCGLFKTGCSATTVKLGTRETQADFDPLVFAVLISVNTQVNVGLLNARMKQGQLLEFVLDELNQGAVGLEVDGLDLYLHVGSLEGETSKDASRIKW